MSRTKKKRVGLYARVSTTDRDQNPETQLLPLRENAERRGFISAGEYIDYASGRSDDREEFNRLLEDVRKGRLDAVMVFRYDRFARSVQALINAVEEFKSLGIDFISYQENTDTTTPQGKLFFTFIAGFAEFESALISERVRAGMLRAKKEGKRVSRPRIKSSQQEKIAELWGKKWSRRKIANELGLAYGTVWNYVKELQARVA